MALLALDDARQVHPRLAHQPAPQLDGEFGLRQRLSGRCASASPSAAPTAPISSGVSPAKYGMPNPPPRFTCGMPAPIASARRPASCDRRCLRLDHRRRIERLAAGIDVQAAPLGPRPDDLAGQSPATRGASTPNGFAPPPIFMPEPRSSKVRVDADRQPRPHTEPLADGQRTAHLARRFAIQRHPSGDRRLQLAVALARSGEADRARHASRRKRPRQLAARGDVEPIHHACHQFEDWRVRVGLHGIMQPEPLRHRRSQLRNLARDHVARIHE